ncbi:MAG: Pr6Pr family membrane protein [Firmicutes bacterium]|nr:Pr6Pr family membrane protein [Bacillota bacterium]
MIKNRIFALIFRIVAFTAILFGIIYNTGVFQGDFHWIIFLYYTILSNIFALALFGVLIFMTARKLKHNGAKGDSCFYPRISAAVTVCIMLTLIVFWCVLAPFAPAADRPFLVTYSNLAVHLIAPLLMLADYIMFSVGGKLKRRDPFLFSIVPIAYLVITLIIGFSGAVVYQLPGFERAGSFPYFFLDYNDVGLMMLVYIAALIALYLAMGWVAWLADKKRGKRKNSPS